MKVLKVLLAILAVMGLCSCRVPGGGEPAQPPEENWQEGEPLEMTFFEFSHTGSSTEECFLYSAKQEGGGTRLYTEGLFSGGLIVDTVIDEPVLEQLGEIAGKYRMDRWDGFDKSSANVMDGSSFSLSITLADGTTVSARGSNKFPDGYGDAEREICTLFEELIDRYGN